MNNIVKQPEGGLLQSGHWAGFVRAVGGNTLELIDDVFGIVQKLPVVGQYLYVPRLPIGVGGDFAQILQIAQSGGFGWLRCDVASQGQLENLRKVVTAENLRIVKAPHDMQPRTHLILPLDASAEELLVRMKSKTRYNIRLAGKKGVVVKKFTVNDGEEFEQSLRKFCDLVVATAKRKGVSFHSSERYQKMFEVIPPAHIALYIAQIGDEADAPTVATNIVTTYGGVATYLHGATADEHREVMAPFLLQYRAIIDAICANCAYYDFGGVFPDSTDAGKQGITRFKKGFAPKVELTQTAGSYDIVFSNWKYLVYKLLQKIK